MTHLFRAGGFDFRGHVLKSWVFWGSRSPNILGACYTLNRWFSTFRVPFRVLFIWVPYFGDLNRNPSAENYRNPALEDPSPHDGTDALQMHTEQGLRDCFLHEVSMKRGRACAAAKRNTLRPCKDLSRCSYFPRVLVRAQHPTPGAR